MAGSQNSHQLSDMLASQKSTRGSLYQSLTNDSVASLALSNTIQDSSHVDAYLASLTRDNVPRSPSLRPTTAGPSEASLKIAYLHREIQLLKNDLNFERYLKQQHLSHIGQLRRKQIREARVEAETQNLINSNRGLKSKLEEAKRLNAQIKKETEKSRTHSRKWESELSGKLRVLREEQKKWNLERERLNKDLGIALENVKSLRQVVVTSERNELAAKQKVASVESSLDELDRLRAEVEKLTARIRSYEAAERDAVKAKENEITALNRVELLEMELRARDDELMKSRNAFEEEVQTFRSREIHEDFTINKNGNEFERGPSSRRAALSHEVIDSALAISRARIIELKKAHNHLLQRYNSLQSAYVDVRERLQQVASFEEPLLLGGISGHRSGSPSPPGRPYSRRGHAPSETEPFTSSAPPTGPLPAIPNRPGRLDTSHISNSNTPTDGRSPSGVGTQHFQAPQPFNPPGSSSSTLTSGNGSSNTGSSENDAHGKPKIKPQSDGRIYGRGESKMKSYYRI
jgi:solute carrier family 25 protein 16